MNVFANTGPVYGQDRVLVAGQRPGDRRGDAVAGSRSQGRPTPEADSRDGEANRLAEPNPDSAGPAPDRDAGEARPRVGFFARLRNRGTDVDAVCKRYRAAHA